MSTTNTRLCWFSISICGLGCVLVLFGMQLASLAATYIIDEKEECVYGTGGPCSASPDCESATSGTCDDGTGQLVAYESYLTTMTALDRCKDENSKCCKREHPQPPPPEQPPTGVECMKTTYYEIDNCIEPVCEVFHTALDCAGTLDSGDPGCSP